MFPPIDSRTFSFPPCWFALVKKFFFFFLSPCSLFDFLTSFKKPTPLTRTYFRVPFRFPKRKKNDLLSRLIPSNLLLLSRPERPLCYVSRLNCADPIRKSPLTQTFPLPVSPPASTSPSCQNWFPAYSYLPTLFEDFKARYFFTDLALCSLLLGHWIPLTHRVFEEVGRQLLNIPPLLQPPSRPTPPYYE